MKKKKMDILRLSRTIHKPNVIWITSPWVDNKRPTEDYIQITDRELDRQADQYEKERKV